MLGWMLALAWATEPPAVEAPPLADPFEEPLDRMEAVARSGYPRGGTLLAIVALEEHPDHPRAPIVRLEVSRVQRDLGLFREEELTLARGLEVHGARWEPWFELALLDAQLQRQDFGALTAAHAERAEWPSEISGAAMFYGAWGRAGVGDDDGAQTLLAKVRGDLEPQATAFSRAIDTVPVRRRSPALAGVLSVVPGVGHAYAGDSVGAAANLVVTGALGGAAAYFATQDEPVLFTVFGILGGASLFAGIGDASRQAEAFNRRSRVERFETLAGQWWLHGRIAEDDEDPVQIHVGSMER